MATPARARRRRRWPLVLAVLAVLLGGAVWWLSRLLEPERLAAFLLQRASAATGLALQASGPAEVGLWPDLHVSVAGLSATAAGGGVPLFTARRLDLVLPWSALLDREPVLQRLRLSGPVLQRDALARWLDTRPEPVGPPPPLRLPELTAGVEVDDGAVVGDSEDAWSLRGLSLDTSPLLPGEEFTATANGELHREGEAQAIGLSLATTPRTQGDALLLDPLSLVLEAPMLPGPLALQGGLQLQHPVRLAVRLGGQLAQWPQEWPALPADALPLDFTLAYDGPTDFSEAVALHAQGGETSLDVQAAVPDLIAWRADPTASPLPPADTQLSTPRLELGAAVLSGIEFGTDAAAASDAADTGTATQQQ